jgi:hypothetical protein
MARCRHSARALALVAAVFLSANATLAAGLPPRLQLPAPFPQIVAQAPTIEFVAPGVQEGDYELLTVNGPISVHVVAADLRRSDVRIGAVLSHEHLVSSGETVADMAQRAGAVAGINGDYFDIDSTNAPTNLLVENGQLVRTPSARPAVAIGRHGDVRFAVFSFGGSVQIATNQPLTLDAINAYPPPGGGTSLITPGFGTLPPITGVTLVRLTPLDGALPSARYRVDSIADGTVRNDAGNYLAIGSRAYDILGTPDIGDVVGVSGDLSPDPPADLVAAVGGGPMILHNGLPFVDPSGPAGAPNDALIPASAIAAARDGTVYFIEVDGRQHNLSIGVTRPQLAAIARALGASEGMALDGGGSSTLVTREPGDAIATVRNAPSDGRARPVADGLFIFSDAPRGPPARIAVRPDALRALPGAQIKLRVAVTDAGGAPARAAAPLAQRVEPADLGSVRDGTFVAARAGFGTLHVSSGSLSGSAPIVVAERPARLQIVSERNWALPGEHVAFTVRAADRDGFAIALPPQVAWSASGGEISDNGVFTAGQHDAVVSAQIGTASVSRQVLVGVREAPLSLGDRVGFSTAPRDQPGSVSANAPCAQCLSLRYDFSGAERAAYANVNLALPQNAIGVAFDVVGDGKGALLRVSALNTIDERAFVPAAKLDFTGPRHVIVRFPTELAQAKRLESIYILNGVGGSRVRAAGTIIVRNLHALLAGTGAGFRQP